MRLDMQMSNRVGLVGPKRQAEQNGLGPGIRFPRDQNPARRRPLRFWFFRSASEYYIEALLTQLRLPEANPWPVLLDDRPQSGNDAIEQVGQLCLDTSFTVPAGATTTNRMRAGR